MTDPEIIRHLQAGENLAFGMHGRNLEVINLMTSLEKAGLIRAEDDSLSQETRRSAIWIADARRTETTEAILASLHESN